MAAIELMPEVGDDYDRILDHLIRREVANAALHIESIVEAITVLEDSPLLDRDSQYVSIRCSERLAEARIEPLVGSKGDSQDNALAEPSMASTRPN